LFYIYVAGHILAIIKKGEIVEMGACSTPTKLILMILMMSKATHHVNY